ncbi:MAG: type II toxin-antitoxin system HipA family toxin [Chitinispirillia bacterium]|nr:type II toxin-antitoxin system HipA family toxin [Chitinispirillia bacterium]
MNSINVFISFGNKKNIHVGELYLSTDTGRHFFKYEPSFLSSGLDISPISMPLGNETYSAPLGVNFYNLHCAFADSLPDAWGRAVQDAEFLKINIDEPTALERLAFIGHNGVGALNYHPAQKFPKGEEIAELATLRKAAQRIIKGNADEVSEQLLKCGGSVGGARPKFLVDMKENNHEEIRYTQGEYKDGYIPMLLKVPTFSHDHYQKIEYIYSQIAYNAGLNIPESYLITGKKSDLAFFAMKRFDCLPNGRKFHVHTLAGLLNINFNDTDIEAGTFLHTVDYITRDHRQIVEAYKIIAFNYIGFNNDDHAKNFSFLMDDKGQWSLAPAYDIGYSKGQNELHFMRLNGKRRNAEAKDFRKIAENFNIKGWNTIIEKILTEFEKWPVMAKDCGIPERHINKVNKRLRENIHRVEKGLYSAGN